ncbi:MAG: hypothetical protein ACKOOI_18415, partial [Pirellula sp.]
MNSASGWCRCEGGFDYDSKSLLIDKLEAEMASPTFWDSPEKAQSVVLELKNLRKVVDPLKQVVASCSVACSSLSNSELISSPRDGSSSAICASSSKS